MAQALEELPLTKKDIEAFSAQAQLHPGIVVGHLQHRGRLPWAHPLTHLKARYVIQTSA